MGPHRCRGAACLSTVRHHMSLAARSARATGVSAGDFAQGHRRQTPGCCSAVGLPRRLCAACANGPPESLPLPPASCASGLTFARYDSQRVVVAPSWNPLDATPAVGTTSRRAGCRRAAPSRRRGTPRDTPCGRRLRRVPLLSNSWGCHGCKSTQKHGNILLTHTRRMWDHHHHHHR